MTLQVLVSTMDQKDHRILRDMNLQSDAIIVNQCDKDSVDRLEYQSHCITLIHSTGRGLSKSRNDAIRAASAEICLLADDDLVYSDRYRERILEVYKQNPEYDIIVFQVEGIERPFKKYHPRQKRLRYLTSMKVSSVEISLKHSSIVKHHITFDEAFGSGAKYHMGEENIFLFRCLQKGLKILYVPMKIADLHITDSTWFSGFNQKYFTDRGAAFTAMSKRFSKLLILQFAFRHYRQCTENMPFFKALRYMFEGRKTYLKDK